MRPIGFSTGALSPGDVPRALSMLAASGTTAVELSALRVHEVAPLRALAASLDVSAFSYVAVHAPSRYEASEEASVADAMIELAARGWPIVVHPDAILDHETWRPLGALAVIENMDKRKPIGRNVAELGRVFDRLPEATFCFDLGHARQVDRTMIEACFLAKELRGRLRHLHVSEVNTQSRHVPLSWAAVRAFQEIAALIPEDTPMILETPVGATEIHSQTEMAAEALNRARSSSESRARPGSRAHEES
jgi:hypothetical protein